VACFFIGIYLMFILNAHSKCLERCDLLSLGAFLALADDELHLLAFFQGFETFTLDGTEMGKYIGA